MIIAACIKLVPSPYLSVELDQTTHRVKGLHEFPFVVNPADLAALELAVRMKEQVGAKVIALTAGCFVPANVLNSTAVALSPRGLRNSAGRLRTPDALRRCLATGADSIVAIGLNRPEGSRVFYGSPRFRPINIDSMMIAPTLAECIHRLKAELVFCGDHSYDLGNGLVGPVIAERLNMSCTTSALSVTMEQGERNLLVLRRLPKGERELVHCALPAVVTVEERSVVPRYFTMPALINAFKSDIETVELAALGLSIKETRKGRSMRLLGLYPPRPRTRKIFIPDVSLSVEERNRLIMSGGMSQKSNKNEQLVEGDVERITAEIVLFLQSHGILPPA